MFDKILEEFLSFNPEFKSALKFLSDAEDYNVSIKEDNNNVSVKTTKVFTDDEYDEYVKGVIATWKTVANLVDSEFVVSVKVGERPVDVYKFNKEKNEFSHVEPTVEDKAVVKYEPYVASKTEAKSVKGDGIFDPDKYKVDINDFLDKCKTNGVKSFVKDDTSAEQETTPLSFAADLKNRISKEIKESEELFDVDFAIENMHDIFDDGSYEPFYDDSGNFIGINVPVEHLVEDFDGLSDDVDKILENESYNVYQFVNRCINELGFSNVIPEREVLDDEYHTIVFQFVF